ncbi:metallophosphoesterase [Xanthocytophaga agilis]|uniref:Metallophosphoesterase n=1 Tax=Xanthocytophaga agilis TaxID=3048010 RepID=A0AAE3QW17_9BACT|nr:metallophosphoesterase [Xanthocytophaga agilis]MDJ1499049.1 metallophosphoesterase [Xanthocytophaga agilis]
MRHFFTITLFIFYSSFLSAQSPKYTLFLLGDAGAPVLNGQDPTLQLLKTQLEKTPNSALIILGDNIYQNGMPDEESSARENAEARIVAQLKILESYKGNTYVVPGNHDWKRGKVGGWKYLENQEKFVENYLKRGNVFLPDEGCPGPVEIALTNQATLVILDTQWWLQPKEDRPGEDSDCECKNEAQVVERLQDIMTRNQSKQVIVAAHHPMYTYGEHNGAATWKDHIFPFTHLKKNLYIPLPILGSIMPLYRGAFGDIQDMKHGKNRFMRKSILDVLTAYPNTIYVNGHDHNLQYIKRDSMHFITSGAGSKRTVVRNGKYALFTDSQKGFARLDFYEDGTVGLEFWEAIKPESAVFKQTIISNGKPAIAVQQDSISPKNIVLPKSQIVSASQQYGTSKWGEIWLGKNYRAEWKQPIEVPVFDIEKERLKILQKGGGQQTKSLRLEDASGKQFVLRSIEKDPESAIPEFIRKTVFADLVQDQISAAHPYGAIAVPGLAEAAGVPHANPKVVFIPDDPHFGQYQKLFANTLAIFEERNPGNEEDENTKSYSTIKVVEKLEDDNDNRVNQQAVVRARLFDMFISDWDRHDDQWRWVGQKTEKGIIFSPVPRDRDQAFFINEGWIPKLASRKWAMPKIQGFGYTIRDVRTLNFNARYFDRSFLTELSLPDWLQVAKDIQQRMTDEVIEKSVHQLPDSVFKIRGQEIINKLKSRREILPQEAEKFYRFLARKVDVVGSDKNEYFLVNHLNDTQIEIKVYKTNKDGDSTKALYTRTFSSPETKEISLYGLGGKDLFMISGNTNKSIKVRIIGGGGKDVIADNSRNSAGKTIVYDTKDNTEIKTSASVRDKTSDDPKVNEYNRKAFKYDLVLPLLSAQYNPDDGVFFGGGVLIRKQGFRKEPFAAQHKITVNHAAATEAYNFDYQGTFTNVFPKTDLQINAEIKAPNFVNNFFGLSNESAYDKEQRINYYRVRFENLSLNALFFKKLSSQTKFFLGPQIESVEIESSSRKRFIYEYASENNLPESFFDRKSYAGLMAGFRIDSRDNKVYPTNGVFWNADLKVMRTLNDNITQPYTQLSSELAFYWSIKLPARVTFATRFGGGVNFTNYEFFQANSLGGLTNLRGYRRTRFSGRDSFYNNTEVRVRLFSFRTYLFPAFGGIVGFHDVGRVWVDNEKSNVWHTGYGGGIFLVPFQQVVITALYGFSKEDSLPVIRLGFFF